MWGDRAERPARPMRSVAEHDGTRSYTGNDLFGSLDLGTGVFSLIGNMGSLLSGLGVSGVTIYGGVDTTDNLDTVNTGSGASPWSEPAHWGTLTPVPRSSACLALTPT